MWIPIGIVFLFALVMINYNLLVRARNMVSEAWSGIDVQLKRRHDLIPNLIESVNAYSSHERDLFENIAETRSKSMTTDDIPAKGAVETSSRASSRHCSP